MSTVMQYNYTLWKAGEPVAACPSADAHEAARRLLLGESQR